MRIGKAILKSLEAMVVSKPNPPKTEEKPNQPTLGVVVDIRKYDSNNRNDREEKDRGNCSNLPVEVTYITSLGDEKKAYSPVKESKLKDINLRFFKGYKIGDNFP
ncbi:hypothetical protein CMI38_04020 [Candidatus Pacearchaeota archaeon]|jgi:hypothetical protein|nr:hypothetical protein [Candidatus Pacearchaeota archaeon]|tara:strand:- start:357 stop:671 length:315 start_codon:yes stop_codon:yes gene_type:complete